MSNHGYRGTASRSRYRYLKGTFKPLLVIHCPAVGTVRSRYEDHTVSSRVPCSEFQASEDTLWSVRRQYDHNSQLPAPPAFARLASYSSANHSCRRFATQMQGASSDLVVNGVDDGQKPSAERHIVALQPEDIVAPSQRNGPGRLN